MIHSYIISSQIQTMPYYNPKFQLLIIEWLQFCLDSAFHTAVLLLAYDSVGLSGSCLPLLLQLGCLQAMIILPAVLTSCCSIKDNNAWGWTLIFKSFILQSLKAHSIASRTKSQHDVFIGWYVFLNPGTWIYLWQILSRAAVKTAQLISK